MTERDDLWRWDAVELASAIRTRRISSRDAVASHLVEAPLGEVEADCLATPSVGRELVGVAPHQAKQSVGNASLANALLSCMVGEGEMVLLHDISSKFEFQYRGTHFRGLG